MSYVKSGTGLRTLVFSAYCINMKRRSKIHYMVLSRGNRFYLIYHYFTLVVLLWVSAMCQALCNLLFLHDLIDSSQQSILVVVSTLISLKKKLKFMSMEMSKPENRNFFACMFYALSINELLNTLLGILYSY